MVFGAASQDENQWLRAIVLRLVCERLYAGSRLYAYPGVEKVLLLLLTIISEA